MVNVLAGISQSRLCGPTKWLQSGRCARVRLQRGVIPFTCSRKSAHCSGIVHHISSSSSPSKSSSGKSPTVTFSGRTKTACFALAVKYRTPSTLPHQPTLNPLDHIMTHSPSPFPKGSSNSTPTHTPPLPILAVPAYRIVPLLSNPPSLPTRHRAPGATLAGADEGGGGV